MVGPSFSAESTALDNSLVATQSNGIKIEIQSLPPEQVAAFYLNRGFTESQIAPYQQACVFSFKIQNVDGEQGQIELDQRQWQWHLKQDRLTVPTLEDWLAIWQTEKVTSAARLAFRWAQFPMQQAYAPGDWNQGMIAVPLDKAEPPVILSLTLKWQRVQQGQKKSHQIQFPSLLCQAR